MSQENFVSQLTTLGYKPAPVEGQANFFAFPYPILVGKFAGKEIMLALLLNGDVALNPPPGPHISPRLLPLQQAGEHPLGGVHASPLGDEWQYWSRPFKGWAQTNRSARAYMAHINALFDTQ